MKILCIQCGGEFSIKAEQLGGKGSCPHCGAEITLPKAHEETPAHAAPRRSLFQILDGSISGLGSMIIHMAALLLIGVGIPVLLFSANATGFALLFSGASLTLVFTSLAFFASVSSRDKARGIGYALLLWFYFALIYDGLILLIIFNFSDYPLEKVTLLFAALNPIDLGRIFVVLKMDVSALMGLTSALYKDFFGSSTGMLFTLGIMFLWIVFPLWLAVRRFKKKDL